MSRDEPMRDDGGLSVLAPHGLSDRSTGKQRMLWMGLSDIARRVAMAALFHRRNPITEAYLAGLYHGAELAARTQDGGDHDA